jgi:hypothetical protein
MITYQLLLVSVLITPTNAVQYFGALLHHHISMPEDS